MVWFIGWREGTGPEGPGWAGGVRPLNLIKFDKTKCKLLRLGRGSPQCSIYVLLSVLDKS